MKSRNYKSILAFITVTILATISLQIYWNIKNYAENERRLINDVQLAFDNGIEHYYEEDAKNTFMALVENSMQNLSNDTVFRREFRKNHFPLNKKQISSISILNKSKIKVPSRKDSVKSKQKLSPKLFWQTILCNKIQKQLTR